LSLEVEGECVNFRVTAVRMAAIQALLIYLIYQIVYLHL